MPSGDVLVLIDEHGRVIEWGRLAEELLGLSADDAVDQMATALVQDIAAADELRREASSDFTSVLVKPMLRGSSVVWQILAAGDAVPGRDVATLRSLFAPSPSGVHVLDEQLRVVRLGTPQLRRRDVATGHLADSSFAGVFGPENLAEETAVAREVLRSGRPVVNRVVRGVRGPGRAGRRTLSVSYFRLEGFDGDVLGVVASVADVTESERARERMAFLDEIRTQVGQGLNLGAACRELAAAAVPAFATTVVVEVIEGIVRGQEAPPVPLRQNVSLRRAASQGPGAASPVSLVGRLPTGTPFSQVLVDPRPFLLAIDDASVWQAADPVRTDIIRRSGAHSLIVAPLVLRDRALGVVTFYRGRDADAFEEEDLVVASDVCAHASLCIDNVTRYMREWIVAQTVQRQLLPQEPAAQGTLEISHLHEADPEGGGAWFDVIPLPGSRTLLVVGEVSGQGITTAITVGLLRTAVQALAAMDLQPDELLARLNDTVARLAAGYAAADLPGHEPLTATCTLAIYDPADCTCTVASAGAPEPLSVLPDGTSSSVSVSAGPPLAGPGEAPFPAETVDLPEGSILAIGTAAASRVLTPAGPLRQLLLGSVGKRPLDELSDRLRPELRSGQDVAAGEPLVLLVRTKALPSDRVLTRALPSGPEAAPIAREATRRQLGLWGVDEETAFTIELIVSELVGNAVRYGAPPLRLRLILGQMLSCEVSDAANSAPHVQHARTVDETGRGLFILATLASRWGARYHAPGKTVWAELLAGTPGATTAHAPGRLAQT